VVVELPGHMPTYWATQLEKLAAGTPEWRKAQRQYLVAMVATNNPAATFATYETLRKNGGVELGDAALASSGIASATDKEFAAALAPLATTPVARYLIAGRNYRNNRSVRVEAQAGMIGALWTLRDATAWLAKDKPHEASEKIISLGTRAFDLRLVGTAVTTQRYNAKAADIARLWDSVAIGDYRNVARAQAALYLFNRGAYDQAAERVASLVADLDLKAMPPQLGQLEWQFQSSRRGPAGWQLVWATWRDRALASDSFEHVLALLGGVGQHPNDLPTILARAAELAKGDVDRVLMVANIATNYGQPALAQSLVEPIVKAHPSRELLQLAGQMAQRQGRVADALAYYEQAQSAGQDEEVGISTVRNELSQIIAAAHQLAVQSVGPARTAAVAKAAAWATRWRTIDPGNPAIDQQMGELYLAVNDAPAAWRQLSTVIERDPMSGEGYKTVAESFERQGRVAEAIEYWHQAVVIDQTNPTHRIREAQALIAVGRSAEGDAILSDVANRKWHVRYQGIELQARQLLERGKRTAIE
jgi:tetratricopeptide (TPR) repeat protein